MEFHLTAGTESDSDFMMAVTETVMRGHIEKSWGFWDTEGQWGQFRATFQSYEHQLIYRSDIRCGYLATRRSARALLVARLLLLPDHQNHGIGSAIMAGLIAEADKTAKSLRLCVLPSNDRAKLFYERIGLRVVETTEEFIHMEYRPASMDDDARRSDDLPGKSHDRPD